MGRRTENCLGLCWVKQITVLDSAESSGELSGSALSQAENCLGQCWVKQRTVWDSAESSGELSGTVLSQAENCLGQRWVKQRTVLDSAESSGELSRSALSQAKCSQEHCLEQRWDHRSAGQWARIFEYAKRGQISWNSVTGLAELTSLFIIV